MSNAGRSTHPLTASGAITCGDGRRSHSGAVTTGITLTFGNLKSTNNADVEDTSGHPIPGLYAAGEIVAGPYYHNYASGTGLMSGAVFGCIAGRNAAGFARE
jgi:tricarballylate dehydrogenase